MMTIISENLCLDIWLEKDIVVIETDAINNTQPYTIPNQHLNI